MLRRFLLTLIVLLLLAPNAAAYAPASLLLPIYTDALAADWQNWSWSTTLDFSAPDPVSGLPDRALSVHYTDPWAGLSLRLSLIHISEPTRPY